MAHIEISPNYEKRPICHFCKKRMAEENYETSRKCYYFEKVFHMTGVYHRYTYRIVDVLVPSCKECAKKDSKLGCITSIITLIVYAIAVYIISGYFAESDHITRNLKNILLACLPSIFIWIICFYVVDFLIRVIFEPKIGLDSYCDNYPPIERLRTLGFEPRDAAPPAKYSGIKPHAPLDNGKFNAVLHQIVSEGDCVIKHKS